MLDVTPTPLQRLLRERRPGYTLPAAFYLSPEVFAADLEVIFGRHWIYVGVEPDVPEAGDVMVVDIGKTSVAIVRDDDIRRSTLLSWRSGICRRIVTRPRKGLAARHRCGDERGGPAKAAG